MADKIVNKKRAAFYLNSLLLVATATESDALTPNDVAQRIRLEVDGLRGEIGLNVKDEDADADTN